jgi:hypothetical protein
MVELTAFLNLAMYIDSTFIFCPACGNMVSLSWGWCPYHATREMLNLTDSNQDGKLKDDFLKKNVTKQTIQEILKSSTVDRMGNVNKERLLVHWTEFIID